MSVSITFKPDFKTRTYTPDHVGTGYELITKIGNEGKPIYIYGSLIIEVDRRRVPRMGYFGDDMIEFWIWITEISAMLINFDKGEDQYLYDPLEQGEPAFQFVREGDTVKLSIVDSEYTDGKADPDWHNVAFSLSEFQSQYLQFEDSFLKELAKQRPDTVNNWKRAFGWPDQKNKPFKEWSDFNPGVTKRSRESGDGADFI